MQHEKEKHNPLTKVSEFRLKRYVKDFKNMQKFYKNFMGYPIREEWETGVMFDTGSGIIELLVPKKKYMKPQGVDVSLQVKNVWKLWINLKGKAAIVFPLRNNSWGDTSFCIQNPEGFHLTFFTKTNQRKLYEDKLQKKKRWIKRRRPNGHGE